MLLGATGCGKSTWIDAMFNYIAGVSLVDDYRFKLIHLTDEEKTRLGRQVAYIIFIQLLAAYFVQNKLNLVKYTSIY